MFTLRFSMLTASAVLLCACSEGLQVGPAPSDAGPRTDAASAVEDAGPTGALPHDGGPHQDSGATPDDSALYSLSSCPGVSRESGFASGYPPCDRCAASHCVPRPLAPPKAPESADCPDDGSGVPGKCVPDAITEREGKFVYGSCTMFLLRQPGACVPSCFVTDDLLMYLRQDDCGSGELCSPCDHPVTGESLGLCGPLYCTAE